jgi:hypothetical protein
VSPRTRRVVLRADRDADVAETSEVYRNEIIGPVLTVRSFTMTTMHCARPTTPIRVGSLGGTRDV